MLEEESTEAIPEAELRTNVVEEAAALVGIIWPLELNVEEVAAVKVSELLILLEDRVD